MQKISKIVMSFLMIFVFFFTFSCKKEQQKKEYAITYYNEEMVVEEKKVKEGEEIPLPSLEKEGYNFLGWYKEDKTKVTEGSVATSDLKLYANFSLPPFLMFKVSGKMVLEQGETSKLVVTFDEGSEKGNVTYTSSDEKVINVVSSSNNGCVIEAGLIGEVMFEVSSKVGEPGDDVYLEHSTRFQIKVVGATYSIEYVLTDEEKKNAPDLPTSYRTDELPFSLPVLEKEDYIFLGWKEEYGDTCYTSITLDSYLNGDLVLYPVFIYPYLLLSTLNDKVILGVEEENTIVVNPIDVPNELLKGYNFTSLNPNVLSIDDKGTIKGIKDGYAEVKVTLKEKERISTTIGITVSSTYQKVNDLLSYFASVAKSNTIAKNIAVVGWQLEYKYLLKSSIIGYLFEDYNQIENIAPISNDNRPGTIKKKYYICVHDTGDAEYTAKEWSDTVYNEFNLQNNKKYEASYQYVVGNDGIYHNIPDNEVAYHAGDGTQVDYDLLPSGVKGSDEHPTITITSDGYFAVNGEKTVIVAPKNGNTILKTSDINDVGIRCIVKNGEYYLGKTWYSSVYKKISNRGGNNNSIGIESCINKGTNIYYTWQKLAKLVAKLLDENDLTINDVVPHHYFSGKNCPQTMRGAGMWDHFLSLVMIEYNVLQYLKDGYEVKLEVLDNSFVSKEGLVLSLPQKSTLVKYKITVSKDNLENSIMLSVMVPGLNTIK